MRAIVEIKLAESQLGEMMREMRVWLDHRKVEPQVFRRANSPRRGALHVEFDGQSEAAEFADHFGGQVLATQPK